MIEIDPNGMNLSLIERTVGPGRFLSGFVLKTIRRMSEMPDWSHPNISVNHIGCFEIA